MNYFHNDTSFQYRFTGKYARARILDSRLRFHSLDGWNVFVIVSTSNRAKKKANYPQSTLHLTCSRSRVSYSSKFFCVKSNPKVNKIKEKFIKINYESIVIPIAEPFNRSHHTVFRKLHPIHTPIVTQWHAHFHSIYIRTHRLTCNYFKTSWTLNFVNFHIIIHIFLPGIISV